VLFIKNVLGLPKFVDDATFIKNFVMGHSQLSVFSPLKLFLVASTRFASTIVMFKRCKLLKIGLLTNGD